MTASEFAAFRSRLIPRYAAEKVRAADWAKDEAEELAVAQTDELLPEGPGSAGMLLLTADDSDGQQVGLVWVALNRPRPGEAWIYDIEINPEHRGKGYGRALLQAAEREAARHDATFIGLNVFGDNAVARRACMSPLDTRSPRSTCARNSPLCLSKRADGQSWPCHIRARTGLAKGALMVTR
jgi:GNAT superfamily N-acetyltransferase